VSSYLVLFTYKASSGIWCYCMAIGNLIFLRKINFALNVFKTDFYLMPLLSVRSLFPIMTYSLESRSIYSLSLSCRHITTKQQFIASLLDAPDILERIHFRVPSCPTRNWFRLVYVFYPKPLHSIWS